MKSKNGKNGNEDNIDMGWFFKIATSDNKKFLNCLFLDEIRIEILGDYTGAFGMSGDLGIGKHKQTTIISVKIIEFYE